MKNFTKFLFLVALTCNLQLLTSNCSAQYVTIPDAGFVSWLQLHIPSCMNGNMLDTSCSLVLTKTEINCAENSSYIYDLTGVQYFKSLDTLDCHSNLTITNIPTLPSTLVYLDCSYNNMASLPALPAGLLTLICGTNRISTLPALPPGLVYFECGTNAISLMPSLPSSLQQLYCRSNNLQSIPALPSGIIQLDCSANMLTSMPDLTSITALQGMDLGNNRLWQIPALPVTNTLFFFAMNNNQITEVDDFTPGTFASGATVVFNYNQITFLTSIPAGINEFDCNNNQIYYMPDIVSTLLTLDCSYNQIASLTFLGTWISTLYCQNNNLDSIPYSASYDVLDCSNNQITQLPAFAVQTSYSGPYTLQTLYCENNLLTSLPPLPSTIMDLNCSNNQLTALPALPSSMDELLVNGNPSLTCLPPIQRLYSGDEYNIFDITGTSVTCLPNRIEHAYFGNVLPMDTMQLCGIFNPHGCQTGWNISGVVSFDSDGNCSTTTGEPLLPNIKMLLYDNTGTNLLQQVYTDHNGYYSFASGLGKFIVKADTTGTPFTPLCPAIDTLQADVVVADSFVYNENFRLVCKSGYDLGVNAITYLNGKFFPGTGATVIISAGDFATRYGVNCHTSGLGGTVQAVVSGPVSISSASGNGSISGNTVTWNVADFSLTDFASGFFITVNTNTGAHAGDQVCFTATISGNSGTDDNLSNNMLSQCFSVVTSHDPNFKEVYPSATTNPGDWLTYTIHFQNTGSAAAENIYVLDTISSNLDISTIQIIAESNTNTIFQVLPGRIVRFNFPNIFLPDSTDNANGSIGYVQFKIKTISSIAAGTYINNTASVYFDYNSPVQTNVAVSAFDVSTGTQLIIHNSEFIIYPNPANDIVNIVLSQPCNNCQMSIIDVLGRAVIQGPLNGTSTFLDLSSIAAGIYFVRVNNESGTMVRKIVKQ